MDIMELGAIGELVGGIAVIGSLIYVGLQIRQSNQLNHAESVRAYVRDYSALLGELRDSEFADLMQRASVDFDGLSRHDQLRVHGWLLPHIMLGWGNYLIDARGDQPVTVLADQSNATTIAAPGFAQWWATFGKNMPTPYKERLARASGAFKDFAFHEGLPWFRPDGDNGSGA